MAFSFGSPLPLDQVGYGGALQAPAPALELDATVPQANAALSTPAPQPGPEAHLQAQPGGLPDIPVSPFEVGLSMLAEGGTPAEAALRVRSVKLQNIMSRIALQQAQDRYDTMMKLGDRDRFLYETDPAAFAKSDAKNLEPQQGTAGNTIFYRGGPGTPGGYSLFAPKTEITSAGVPTTFMGPTDFRTAGYQLPGAKSLVNGAEVDANTGLTGRAVSMAEQVPLTSRPGSFTPQVFGGPNAGNPASAGAPAGAPVANASPSLSGFVGKTGQLDPHAFFQNFWLPQEGGLNPSDGNGQPTKYGINQVAVPGQDVTKLSPQQAEQIFTHQYFGPSGAGNMPPALGLVHADTYGINPKMAQTFLQESGGDPNLYLQMRQQWMQNAIQSHPQLAKYAEPWANRNAALSQIINGAGQTSTEGSAPTPAVSASGPAPAGWNLGPAEPAYKPLIDPKERQAAGINPNDHGSYILTPEGPKQIATDPYGSEWAKGTRQQFLESEGYKQLIPAMAAVQALEHNIGQMTGPAAYTILDTMARTINPGAVARAQVIQTIESHFGLPAHVVGALMNYQGKGSIPLQTQQQILDAVIPFAQSHWDQAKAAYDANSALASRHSVQPEDVTAPIGDRPARMRVGPVPPPAQRQANTIYQTPKGLALYVGNGQWRKLD